MTREYRCDSYQQEMLAPVHLVQRILDNEDILVEKYHYQGADQAYDIYHQVGFGGKGSFWQDHLNQKFDTLLDLVNGNLTKYGTL